MTLFLLRAGPAKVAESELATHLLAGTARMKTMCCLCGLLWTMASGATPELARKEGLASWYGEEHRGKLMANGRKFDPDQMTAASWFYPLGTRVRVKVNAKYFPSNSVLVTITDRGPARELANEG